MRGIISHDLNDMTVEYGGGDLLRVESSLTDDDRLYFTVRATDSDTSLQVTFVDGLSGAHIVLKDVLGESGSLALYLERTMLSRLIEVCQKVEGILNEQN